jgi:hypothetical protein
VPAALRLGVPAALLIIGGTSGGCGAGEFSAAAGTPTDDAVPPRLTRARTEAPAVTDALASITGAVAAGSAVGSVGLGTDSTTACGEESRIGSGTDAAAGVFLDFRGFVGDLLPKGSDAS